MYCKNCGAPLDDNAEACAHCGLRVERAPQTAPSAPPSTPPAPPPTYAPPTYAPPAYAQPVYPPPPAYVPPKKDNAVALVGFILSFIVPLAGLICSIVGLNNARRYNADYKGLAIAGIVIGSVLCAVCAVLLFIYLVYFYWALFFAALFGGLAQQSLLLLL